MIPLIEDKKTTIPFNQLALFYESTLYGSIYLDNCVLAPVINDTNPVFATISFITEDGELKDEELEDTERKGLMIKKFEYLDEFDFYVKVHF